MLNFSPSCERNKEVIAEALAPYFSREAQVLEIGSLSGQHAIHFCQQFPQLIWRPSDLVTNVASLQNNIVQAALSNCLPAIPLDVANKPTWPNNKHDIIYSANTLHIMSWQHVQALFSSLHQVCCSGTILAIYGPFNYNNAFSSPSNEQFELWLKDRDEKSGIRDFEQVNNLAIDAGFILKKDVSMPANNQLLIWEMA
jgi:hypothetical protein